MKRLRCEFFEGRGDHIQDAQDGHTVALDHEESAGTAMLDQAFPVYVDGYLIPRGGVVPPPSVLPNILSASVLRGTLRLAATDYHAVLLSLAPVISGRSRAIQYQPAAIHQASSLAAGGLRAAGGRALVHVADVVRAQATVPAFPPHTVTIYRGAPVVNLDIGQTINADNSDSSVMSEAGVGTNTEYYSFSWNGVGKFFIEARPPTSRLTVYMRKLDGTELGVADTPPTSGSYPFYELELGEYVVEVTIEYLDVSPGTYVVVAYRRDRPV